MRTTVVKMGKPAHPEYRALVDRFIKRLGSHVTQKIIDVRKGEQSAVKTVAALLDSVPSSFVIGLDEHGKSLSSPSLAALLKELKSNGAIKNLVFLIGPPYGLDQSLLARCNKIWALADGVYPSDLAWLMAIEQVYRAHTINSGSPYHHS